MPAGGGWAPRGQERGGEAVSQRHRGGGPGERVEGSTWMTRGSKEERVPSLCWEVFNNRLLRGRKPNRLTALTDRWGVDGSWGRLMSLITLSA